MIRLFEAFAGYGSQAMALKRLGIPFVSVGISEIDKYAIQAYQAVHGNVKNFGDISKINWDEVPDFDLFTYSFPCQDISNAGKQKGLAEGSGTRSSLLWECRKAIEAKKPKYLLMENVKALTQKKFLPFLYKWDEYLRNLGYSNYINVLDARDYGIPQHRERLFMVSIFGDTPYYFPKTFELKLRLKDVLEQNVDEKYYLSKKMQGNITFFAHTCNYRSDIYKPIIKKVGNYSKSRHNASAIVNPEGIAPTCMENHGTVTAVFEPTIPFKGKDIHEDDGLYLNTSDNFMRKGLRNCSRTLKASQHDAGVCQNYRIRKFTERECFRLMGVSEDDINKIQATGISKTQQLKLAGNSIVVDVLYHIFRKLFIDKYNEDNQLLLF